MRRQCLQNFRFLLLFFLSSGAAAAAVAVRVGATAELATDLEVDATVGITAEAAGEDGTGKVANDNGEGSNVPCVAAGFAPLDCLEFSIVEFDERPTGFESLSPFERKATTLSRASPKPTATAFDRMARVLNGRPEHAQRYLWGNS